MDFRKLTGGFAVQQVGNIMQQVEKGSATSGIWKLQQVEKEKDFQQQRADKLERQLNEIRIAALQPTALPSRKLRQDRQRVGSERRWSSACEASRRCGERQCELRAG